MPSSLLTTPYSPLPTPYLLLALAIRLASLHHQIELQRLIERHVRVGAAGGRLRVAAHRVEAVADDAAGEAVARVGHGRQDRPPVHRRVVGLDRAERAEHATVLEFAASHDDLVLVDA